MHSHSLRATYLDDDVKPEIQEDQKHQHSSHNKSIATLAQIQSDEDHDRLASFFENNENSADSPVASLNPSKMPTLASKQFAFRRHVIEESPLSMSAQNRRNEIIADSSPAKITELSFYKE